MAEDERHERYLKFMRELGLDPKYLNRNGKQQDYPYVLRKHPKHREGVFINLDKDIAQLRIDDAYNSYWYRNGYGYSHIHYDSEGHSFQTDLHAWVFSEGYNACLFKEYFYPNPNYDLMLYSTKFNEKPSRAAHKLAEILRQSPSDMLVQLTEEPRNLKLRIELRTTEDKALALAKAICESGGDAGIVRALFKD